MECDRDTFWNFGQFFVLLPTHIQPSTSAPLLTIQKIKIMKKWKNTRRYHFTHAYHKLQSYDVGFLRYEVQQTEIFVILDHFLPFCPSPKNFWKTEKHAWRWHFTQVPKIMMICYTVPVIQHVRDIIFIFQLTLIFAVYHPNNPKNQSFEKWKKCCGIYHQFTHVYQKL